jgi:hypothetical protein
MLSIYNQKCSGYQLLAFFSVKVLNLLSDNLGGWITIILGGFFGEPCEIDNHKNIGHCLECSSDSHADWDYFQPTMGCGHLLDVSRREANQGLRLFLPIINTEFLGLGTNLL